MSHRVRTLVQISQRMTGIFGLLRRARSAELLIDDGAVLISIPELLEAAKREDSQAEPLNSVVNFANLLSRHSEALRSEGLACDVRLLLVKKAFTRYDTGLIESLNFVEFKVGIEEIVIGIASESQGGSPLFFDWKDISAFFLWLKEARRFMIYRNVETAMKASVASETIPAFNSDDSAMDSPASDQFFSSTSGSSAPTTAKPRVHFAHQGLPEPTPKVPNPTKVYLEGGGPLNNFVFQQLKLLEELVPTSRFWHVAYIDDVVIYEFDLVDFFRDVIEDITYNV